MIRKYLAIATLTLCVAPIAAQTTPKPQPSQADLRKAYEDKLAKPFVEFGGWTLDYDEARARAAAENKLIFAYFTVSYFR